MQTLVASVEVFLFLFWKVHWAVPSESDGKTQLVYPDATPRAVTKRRSHAEGLKSICPQLNEETQKLIEVHAITQTNSKCFLLCEPDYQKKLDA